MNDVTMNASLQSAMETENAASKPCMYASMTMGDTISVNVLRNPEADIEAALLGSRLEIREVKGLLPPSIITLTKGVARESGG
jgi:hypothetical protein